MNEIKTIIRSGNDNALAILLVGLLFGWTKSTNKDTDNDCDELESNLDPMLVEDEAQFTIDEEFGLLDELEGFYTHITPDREVEREFTITEYEVDEFGGPKAVKRTISNDISDCSCPWFTLAGNETCPGWSGVQPHIAALLAERANPPSIAVEGGETVADWDRTGCGFLPEELTGTGQLDRTVNDIIWARRKQEKRRKAKQFHAWVEWLKREDVNLRNGAANLRKMYFEYKEQGRQYLTTKQMSYICTLFEEKGVRVWPKRK